VPFPLPEEAAVGIGINFANEICQDGARKGWLIAIPFEVGPLPIELPLLNRPDKFQLAMGDSPHSSGLSQRGLCSTTSTSCPFT